MEIKTIKSPEGIRQLMRELWVKHNRGQEKSSTTIFMVDLPEPTEEDKQIMAANRANHKPVILEESKLQTLLDNATEKLGGW